MRCSSGVSGKAALSITRRPGASDRRAGWGGALLVDVLAKHIDDVRVGGEVLVGLQIEAEQRVQGGARRVLLEVGQEAPAPQRRLSIPAPGLHAAFRELDQRYLKPLFGGQMMPGPDTSVPHRAPLRRPGAGVNGD